MIHCLFSTNVQGIFNRRGSFENDFLSALEAHRIKTTCSEWRKDYPHWWGSVTKDIWGRKFNFPDEKEQDFLIAIDPPIDPRAQSKLIKEREFPVFQQARKRSVTDKAKSHNPIEGRNLVLLVSESQLQASTFRHWISVNWLIQVWEITPLIFSITNHMSNLGTDFFF